MLGRKKNVDKRFYIKEQESIRELGRITILVDRETKVNYIHTWVGNGSGITPLLDKNGAVIIEQ